MTENKSWSADRRWAPALADGISQLFVSAVCPSIWRSSPCAAIFFTAVLVAGVAPATELNSSRQLHSGWKFSKGEQDGAETPSFDDSKWSVVRLPHDWAIAGPFNPSEDGYAGKLPWRGVGWYRLQFTLDCAPDSRVYLDFDGVMAFPKVYINGKLAGDWDYGYTPFRIDVTPFVNKNGTNTLAVRVDTTNHGTRWYPGAGIYRKVTLQIRRPIHIAQWGTCVTTPEVREKDSQVEVQTTVENHTEVDATVGVVCQIHDPDGKRVAQFADRLTIPAIGSKTIKISTQLQNPKRWDIETPQLYLLRTTIVPESAMASKEVKDADAFDMETKRFGFRTVEFSSKDGLQLNGRRVEIHGVNLHHDQGPLGAAFYLRAMERQLEIMRDMGVNAIRTSHNVPAAEVLDLCDQMGILVWEECFDKWNDTADRVDGQPSHEEHARRHLRSMVMRDRSHPSVVIWSIGNEIPADREGVTRERVSMMRNVVREYDTTRPVGMACDRPEQADAGILADLDLTGWNYGRRYARYHERYPDKPIVYSESASALSTRGFYELPLPMKKTDYSDKGQVDSYDLNSASWSDIADSEFKLMQNDRFVAGEFVWTGFDYIGEPTPFNREAISSYFGIVDMCGIPKDRFYLYRSHWRPNTPTVHIVPHWNWPNRVGKPVPVFVYTNGDSAELFLNGKSLGRRTKEDISDKPKDESSYFNPTYAYRLRWNSVTYEPGELEAVAYKNGTRVGIATLRTAGEPTALRLTPDRTDLADSGDDLCYLLVEAVDDLGTPCPFAEDDIHFTVTGAGEIAGVGNRNPRSLEAFQADHRKLFFGKALLIVRTVEGVPGEFQATATCKGMRSASTVGHVRTVASPIGITAHLPPTQ